MEAIETEVRRFVDGKTFRPKKWRRISRGIKLVKNDDIMNR